MKIREKIRELIELLKSHLSHFYDELKLDLDELSVNFKYFVRTFSIKKIIDGFLVFIRKPLLPFTLYRMLFREFINWFLIAQGLFVIILLIIDLFQKINDYTGNSSGILGILAVTLLYIPKSVSWTISIAVMFGTTMTLGTFYSHNELVAIYTSGISLMKFSLPIAIFGLFLSVFVIFADSELVIPAERYRINLFEKITKKNSSGKYDNENITIRGNENNIWNVGVYFSAQNTIQNVILFKITPQFLVNYRIDAAKAVYTSEGWLFFSGVIREWDDNGTLTGETRFHKKLFPDYKEKPSLFKKSRYEIENMTISEAKERLKLLKKLNIEHTKELTSYYKKFSFHFTLLIVALFAIGVSTLSRTNVLILSLFFSVGLAVIYYVLQLVLDVLASTGKIPPVIGAWLSVFIMIPVAIVLINKAKT